MNRRVLISVDLDFFNYAHHSFLNPILAVAMGAGIRKATIFRDHLPDSYNAWPGHKAWKNYTIWNYDEHSDDGRVQDCQEEIGTWCSWLQRKGAKIIWVSEKENSYSCAADDGDVQVDTELLINGSEDYVN